MTNSECDLSSDSFSDKQHGIILGVWDQEKTSGLIKDLERSVNLAEVKCKDLLQQLIYYKKFLEFFRNPKLSKFIHTLKNKNSHLESESDPDTTFRKNMVKFEEIEEKFKENCEEKLFSINKVLMDANKKIGLKNIFLFPTKDYIESLNSLSPDQINASWYDVFEEFVKVKCGKAKSKSEPSIANVTHSNLGFSKITKSELKSYQKLSRLSLSQRKKRRIKGNIYRNGDGRNIDDTFQKFRYSKTLRRNLHKQVLILNTEKPPKLIKSLNVLEKQQTKRKSKFLNKNSKLFKKRMFKKSYRQICSPQSKVFSSQNCQQLTKETPMEKFKINECDLEMICNSLTDAVNKRNSFKTTNKLWNEIPFKDRLTLKSCVRENTPSTVSNDIITDVNFPRCPLILNHVYPKLKSMSLKEKKYDGCRQEGKTQKDTFSRKLENFQHIPWSLDIEELNRMQHTEQVWTSKADKVSGVRKVRSKYTRSAPERFVEYHKSTTKQYSDGQKSVIRSESKRAYAVGSKIMMSDCQRTDFFETNRDNLSASGDSSCNDCCNRLRIEWSNVYSYFFHIYRKYNDLKTQIKSNNLAPSEAELETLENEISCAIEKYKEFMKFYSKFLHLKHSLKSFKTSCETKELDPVASYFFNYQKKLTSRKTYSMKMREALRQVQSLQEKIKLMT